MRRLINTLAEDPRYSKALYWGKLISITGVGQIITQLTGLISGILVIRLLPTHEYALYTLVNTMLGTMTVLADGGIGSGVLAEGGKVWQDKQQLGSVVATGLKLRKKFALFSLIVATPILIYLLVYHKASILTCVLIVCSLIPSFYAALSDSILEVPLRLTQDIKALQKNQIGANLGRLILSGLAIFIFPFSYIAVLCSGIPRLIANITLKKRAQLHAHIEEGTDEFVQSKILKIVKKTLPGAAYYAVSAQITIWLVSIFGSTDAIAQVGALGRLTVFINVFSGIITTLLVPRFARLGVNFKNLLVKFLSIQVLVLAMGAIIVAIVYIFPSQILWVLGSKYAGLNVEVLLISISSSIGMAIGITYALSVARGWVLHPAINIGGHLLLQVSILFFLKPTTAANAIIFSIIEYLGLYFIMTGNVFFEIFQSKGKKILQ